MHTINEDIENDRTIPPIRMLRYDTPAELYANIPQVAGFTLNRPGVDEDPALYLGRLRGSTTPEDAVTYTAFAVEPRFAIRWGMDVVRISTPEIPPADVDLYNWISHWLEYPTKETRWQVMQYAMFAPRRSAVVYLGLAVGWSEGALAPNDPSVMPPWRSAQAVNTAVLRAVAAVGTPQNRDVYLARALDLAAALFRVYDGQR